MPSEEELRDGLRRLSDRGPRPTEADLWTARDHGRRRLRVRRIRRSALVALALVAAVGVGFALTARDDQAEVGPADSPDTTGATVTPSTPSTSTPSTSIWTPPADDPTQPSPAAIAVDREQWTVPEELADCGVDIRTSGWPTTFAANPRQVECFLDAVAPPRTPAQFVSTARDFVGGMTGTIYRVLPAGDLVAIAYDVAIDGRLSTTTANCADIRRLENSTALGCVDASSVTIDASDPTSPTQAAVTADLVEQVVPDGYENCGSVRVTAGWPTTFAFFGSTDCILAAAAAGTPAQYSTSARDFVGGMSGTIFRVEGLERITVIQYEVNAFGSVGVVDTRTCTALDKKFPTPECD